MSVRAVILDVYKTLLDVAPPADPANTWLALWKQYFGGAARLDWPEFCAQADALIAREQAAARAVGIAHPEVCWPDIVRAVVPELADLPAGRQEELLFEQTRCWHTVRLMPVAVPVLRALHSRGLRLGLASNAQAYTLRELDAALDGSGLSRAIFEPDLCFFSFAHGFSKPDPHVFRLLTARLRARGIPPHETLMVGDRLDNDIAPARTQGWQTWQLKSPPEPGAGPGGDWAALAAAYGWS
jgi:FMN phosphatase YigB (HAD superfamily)